MRNNALEVKSLSKTFRLPGDKHNSMKQIALSFGKGGYSELKILKNINFEVKKGEFFGVVGRNGSGKSTLLHILGTLDTPDDGSISISETNITSLDSNGLARFRNEKIGFIFQFHHLLREFTAIENVMMPALIAGATAASAYAKAETILSEVGLSKRLSHKPRQLSGGEQQRVAVARALINDPGVLLADEPSGNLDADTSLALHDLLFELQGRGDLSIIVVTHNMDLAERADRVLVMDQGRLQATDQG